MDNIHLVKETTLTIEKKTLLLDPLYLGSTSYKLALTWRNHLESLLIIVITINI